MARVGESKRTTKETDIRVRLGLDQGPSGQISTGHGFLDHLLEQLQRHGRFALEVEGRGDLQVDVHHLAEDCGITLGQALTRALGERRGIERYGHGIVPMDESLVEVVVDLSGRPYLAFEPAGFEGEAHGFNAFHLRELLRGFCNHAGATTHVRVLSGEEMHHVCEAAMKAFARALARACSLSGDELPSTKGVL